MADSKSEIKRKQVQAGLPPLSEIWITTCPECEGNNCLYTECGSYDQYGSKNCIGCEERKPCPSCHDGNVAIGVCVPPTNDGGTGYYRPLTVDEVEAIFEKHNNPNDNLKTKGRLSREQTMRLIIIGIENGMIAYKGQLCKLIPFKEE